MIKIFLGFLVKFNQISENGTISLDPTFIEVHVENAKSFILHYLESIYFSLSQWAPIADNAIMIILMDGHWTS